MILIKYKLYDGAENNCFDVVNNIMKNRGIKNPQEYFNISGKDEIHYSKLDNIEWAVKEFDEHFCKRNKIGILFDEDCDGITSGAVLYDYIKSMDEDYPLTYIMHTKPKTHGLSDDVTIPDDIELLIIPDASSNDVEQCKALREKGISIIILDHHECDRENRYAIVVNNQLSKNYLNKDLAGVGVTYKFCQALDDYYLNDYADSNIDLVALGLIGDVMDMRSYETKYLVDKGLLNIKNKALQSLINAQAYSMNNIINIHNIQFYIVPVINGLIRFGSLEEKELLIRAFINDYEEFDYKKRGVGIIKENIYDRAARLAKNAKARQDKAVLKSMEMISEKVSSENNNDKVIIVDGTETVDNSLTGLVCMKVADKFDRPCVILNKRADYKNENPSEVIYGGSARNIRHSSCENLKETLTNIGSFEKCTGHPGAFGIEIKEDNIQEARDKLNKLFKDVSNDKVYIVDFVLEEGDINARFIKDLDSLSNYYGKGIEEAGVVTKVEICRDNVELMGKEKNSIAYVNDEGVKFVMFKCNENNRLLQWINDKKDTNIIKIEAVGKPCINIYQGIATPQFIINDFNIIEKYNNELTDIDIDDDDVWGDDEW